MNHRYFIELAYNGTPFNGWQIQKNAPSVQETLNQALAHLCKEKVNVVGCGRTDTGVHARQFFAHFDLKVPMEETDPVVDHLNHFLPKEIVVFRIFKVAKETHARFDAISRTYRYYILRKKDPFQQEFTHFYHGLLNVDQMNKGSEVLMKYRDFTSFSKVKTQVKTNICEIREAHWKEQGNLMIFTITADRFLRNMVRAIVGTLLDVGRNKITPKMVGEIIESKNRSNAGYSVPAKGLFLEKVEYPESLFPQS